MVQVLARFARAVVVLALVVALAVLLAPQVPVLRDAVEGLGLLFAPPTPSKGPARTSVPPERVITLPPKVTRIEEVLPPKIERNEMNITVCADGRQFFVPGEENWRTGKVCEDPSLGIPLGTPNAREQYEELKKKLQAEGRLR